MRMRRAEERANFGKSQQFVENNNEIWSEIAHFSSFLLNFSGFVLTKLNVSAVFSRKKQHILRIRLNQSADDRSLLKKLCVQNCILLENPPKRLKMLLELYNC